VAALDVRHGDYQASAVLSPETRKELLADLAG
jgi:hypothetical protein